MYYGYVMQKRKVGKYDNPFRTSATETTLEALAAAHDRSRFQTKALSRFGYLVGTFVDVLGRTCAQRGRVRVDL